MILMGELYEGCQLDPKSYGIATPMGESSVGRLLDSKSYGVATLMGESFEGCLLDSKSIGIYGPPRVSFLKEICWTRRFMVDLKGPLWHFKLHVPHH